MREERGNVLLLMPAAVLVFMVLGAICVDFGGMYSVQRQLSAAAAAAANDAAGQGIDLELLYRTGEVRVVPERAREVAVRSVAAKGLDRFDASVVEVRVAGNEVAVTVGGRAHHLFAAALPGGPEGADVQATATARAEQSFRG